MPNETFVAAVQYTPMTDIPFLSQWSPGANFGGDPIEVLNSIFMLAVTLGAMLAVFMFIWGALLLITAVDSASKRGEGKTKMQNALTGLLMLLATWVVLSTINPQITSLKLFDNLKKTPESIVTQNTSGYTIGPAADQQSTNLEQMLNSTTSSQQARLDAQARISDLASVQKTLYCFQTSRVMCGQGGFYADPSICAERSGGPCTTRMMPTTQLTKDGPYQFTHPGLGNQRYSSKEVCDLEAMLSPVQTTCTTVAN